MIRSYRELSLYSLHKHGRCCCYIFLLHATFCSKRLLDYIMSVLMLLSTSLIVVVSVISNRLLYLPRQVLVWSFSNSLSVPFPLFFKGTKPSTKLSISYFKRFHDYVAVVFFSMSSKYIFVKYLLISLYLLLFFLIICLLFDFSLMLKCISFMNYDQCDQQCTVRFVFYLM